MLFTLSLGFLIISSGTYAQRKRIAMPEEGYWVIVSNVKTPKKNTVYFYNPSKQLISQQEIIGKKLNVSKKRIVRELNGMLFQSLTAWNQKEADNNRSMMVKRN